MSTAEVLAVVGARPNFVKVAPVVRALAARSEVRVRLLHTGQHYDHALSGSFLDQLGMPQPDVFLGVGSGSHAEQTAGVLVGVERVLEREHFDLVLVPGDVNSTLAAALAAAKCGVAIAHLEAGLRSGDWTMPEEINRVVTDRIADLLLCPSADAVENLRAEGAFETRIALVGNTMIDSLLALLPSARSRGTVERLGLRRRDFTLVTLHRPALVDDPVRLGATLEALSALAKSAPVVFPLHPRTRARLDAATFVVPDGLRLLKPLEYLDFVALEDAARLVITDSGGVQEETSVLGVPCLTYRTTTERPVTVELGTNQLVGVDPVALAAAAAAVLEAPMPRHPPVIPLWDGAAGARCAEAVAAFLSARQHFCHDGAVALDVQAVGIQDGPEARPQQRPAGHGRA